MNSDQASSGSSGEVAASSGQAACSLRLADVGRSLFHSLSVALVAFDGRLNVAHRNAAAESLLHDDENLADALARGTAETHVEEWRRDLREVLETRREHRFEHVQYHDASNRDSILNLLCVPLVDLERNVVLGGLLMAEDVTAHISMEQRLAVSERLAAVGKLAARVAHELNNPLDGILRYINLALRVLGTDAPEQITKYLEESRTGLRRMAQITSELLEFSRSTHAGFEESSINTAVEDAVRVMSGKARTQHVSVVISLEERLPAVRGGELFQVFCNLIKNAIDAMPGGGTLTVRTQVADRQAVIRFDDTGAGLEEPIDRLFEPFYTTKAPGKGTGLGLAICKDIVEKYHGRITAGNREEGGASFTVRLPLESCIPAEGGGR